jgi:hypothetical protein
MGCQIRYVIGKLFVEGTCLSIISATVVSPLLKLPPFRFDVFVWKDGNTIHSSASTSFMKNTEVETCHFY